MIMKFLYKTPEITVEELTKSDVLCSSAPNPQAQDNGLGSYSGSGGVGSGSGFDFDLGSLVGGGGTP